jgi:hypothetical protein
MILIYHTISHNIVINDMPLHAQKLDAILGIVTPPFIGIVIAIM